MTLTLTIRQKIRNYSPEDPNKVSFVCKTNESAEQLREALVVAGFATEVYGERVLAYQGDGTI